MNDEFTKERSALEEWEENCLFAETINHLLAKTTWENSSAREAYINYVYTLWDTAVIFERRPGFRDYINRRDPIMNGFNMESLIADRGYSVTKDDRSTEITVGLSRGCLDKHDDEETNSIKKSIFEEFEKVLETEGYLYTVTPQ